MVYLTYEKSQFSKIPFQSQSNNILERAFVLTATLMALNRISAVDFKDKLIAFIEKIMKEIYEKDQFTILDLTIQSK